MKLSEAYEQVMLERDLAMQAKEIRDRAERELRERLQSEIADKIKEIIDERTS